MLKQYYYQLNKDFNINEMIINVINDCEYDKCIILINDTLDNQVFEVNYYNKDNNVLTASYDNDYIMINIQDNNKKEYDLINPCDFKLNKSFINAAVMLRKKINDNLKKSETKIHCKMLNTIELKSRLKEDMNLIKQLNSIIVEIEDKLDQDIITYNGTELEKIYEQLPLIENDLNNFKHFFNNINDDLY